MRAGVTVGLVLVGLLHLLPAVGMLGAARLQQLYGLDVSEPSLQLLMRHRALLFGLLGVGLLIAAFKPAWHGGALLVATVSVLGFLVLGAGEPLNAAVQRVWWADVAALGVLALSAVAWHFSPAVT
jgi:hypothetical protein